MKNQTEIIKIVGEYNKYRNPEVVAEIFNIGNGRVTLEFSGSFCFGCGVNDYFDDFVVEAEDRGLNLEIKKIKQAKEDSFLVEFEIDGGENER